MGGRQYTRSGRRGRPGLRRAVLLTVFGVLAGALLLCARSGESHVPPPPPAGAQTAAQVAAQVAAQAQGHGSAHVVVCVSPYDLPGCSPLARVIPGVLPVPPPVVAVAGGELPSTAPPAAPGPIRTAGPPARAPDLHALQVLRT
ncbi:hypothetical protein [Streptomyces sp. WM6368]|uniref:hypothetical protein n=1 Tax=Streptomyces sp. WM6368 TaxID=1415554 RepID=UPI000B1EB4E6|nr:hypothetical protein [Streptomyces sp. WM6368]